MSGTRSAIQYRPLRAPREHGSMLIDPPLAELPSCLAGNVSLLRDSRHDWQGREWAVLARLARSELLTTARRYTSAYRDLGPPPIADDWPLLLTGHQPELYHPGVWFKNFAMSTAATRLRAHAVHVLIDNDAVRKTAIRVPEGTREHPRWGWVPFDASAEEVAYEERNVLAPGLFATFHGEVRRRLPPFVADPVIDSLWPRAVRALRTTPNLGRAISQSRHELEGEWGLSTWEVPLSELCRQEAFRWFLAHVLAHLPRFRAVYNTALEEYRHVHRLRSRNHPVPALAQSGEWLESPFWCWTRDQPRRRRLFVRQRGKSLDLSDLSRAFGSLSLHADATAEKAVEQLGEFEAHELRLRPRALTTTMFARLLLGDLFFHGIGGAKYDQVTDVIIHRFFGCVPPAFVVLTATATLRGGRELAPDDDLRRIDELLRQLRYNPQRRAAETEESRRLIAEKQRWLASNSPPGQRRERHHALARLNDALQPFVEAERTRLLEERQRWWQLRNQDRILGSREYAFCLHSTEVLRTFLLDI